jgi:hypothetical protein
MTFLHPKALFWAPLAVPIVLFYVWRTRTARRPVAAGFLWEQVFGAAGRRSAWWPFRRPVSLLVQLTVLSLLVLALAEPVLGPPQRLVIVIDTSAGTTATDAVPSRLDQAKQLARRYVAALGDHDELAIISAGETLDVRCGLTSRKGTLAKALDTIAPSKESTRAADAVALGRRLLDGHPNGHVICLTGRAEPSERGSSASPPWLLLAAGALVVIVIEWRLFQRRWTC